MPGSVRAGRRLPASSPATWPLVLRWPMDHGFFFSFFPSGEFRLSGG